MQAGEVLIRQGEMGDSAYVLLKGGLEVQKQSSQSVIKIDVRKPGDIVGEMALLARAPRAATVISQTDSEALRIPQQAFEDLLSSSPGAAMAVLHWVMGRLSQNEALLHQQEKMAALGTLSAGLAHELNNPAAAAQRGVSDLRKIALRWQALTHELESLSIAKGLAQWFESFKENAMKQLESPAGLNALEKIEFVEEMQSWLEAQHIDIAWELAPALVNYDWKVGTLKNTKQDLAQTPELLVLAIQWLGHTCMIMDLLSEVQQSTQRISQIVQAMKSYTYLDQAPLLEVDVHEGLENTLLIMQHKLKQGVSVKREYSPDLPRIEAYASELNQVWTNIIDNAVDAMQGKGQIILRTYLRSDQVNVEIQDNGPGIAGNILGRIFEPFFTTKPPGAGTGLGLHIAHDIIVNRHQGQFLVESIQGKTVFRAILPIKRNASP
jgi:signal transduction histidine kinase